MVTQPYCDLVHGIHLSLSSSARAQASILGRRCRKIIASPAASRPNKSYKRLEALPDEKSCVGTTQRQHSR